MSLSKWKLSSLMLALTLSACGGGGGGSTEPNGGSTGGNGNSNVAPVISWGGTTSTYDEGTEITFTPTVTDADGDALTFNWQQTAGSQTLQLGQTDQTSISFNAPLVDSDEQYQLTFTASDGSITATQVITFNVLDLTINSPVAFNLANAVSVVSTQETAVQIESHAESSSISANRTQLNSFKFLKASSAKELKAAKLDVFGMDSHAIQNGGIGAASNFFIIDEDGSMQFAADSEYDFKVSYSVVKELENEAGELESFLYFVIDEDDIWHSASFINATGGCAVFKIAVDNGEWNCVTPNIVVKGINDGYRQTMSDDSRKPLQVDDYGNVFILGRELLTLPDSDWVDVNYGTYPTIQRISPEGEQIVITGDDLDILSYVKINDSSLVYNYQQPQSGESGLRMLTNITDERPSTVDLGESGYWNNFFYTVDDNNTIIFSQSGYSLENSGIAFAQESTEFSGGVERFTLNTSAFATSNWDTKPRRVILADDGAIYGLFQEEYWEGEDYKSFLNLKRMLPYSTATFARFETGQDWWGYFDGGNRNVQISKGFVYYLEDDIHRAFGERTLVKAVRMADGEKIELLADDEWTQRYDISSWKLAQDILYFSGFDLSTSAMISGEIDTSKMKQGYSEDEFLTITENASIVGESNTIEDLEVLRPTSDDERSDEAPAVVQMFTDPENIYSASIEFNKWMDYRTVNEALQVSYVDEDDMTIVVPTLNVWLNKSVHMIFDVDTSADSLSTDPLSYSSDYSLSIADSATDLDGASITGEGVDLSISFSTRPEQGGYVGSGEAIEGISDGQVFKYAADTNYYHQASGVLVNEVDQLNHRVEWSSPSRLAGRFEVRLYDGYEIDWTGVESLPIDDDGNAWEFQKDFQYDIEGNVYVEDWDWSTLDPVWEQHLPTMSLFTPETGDNGEVYLSLTASKTYSYMPYHYVDIDGNVYASNWDEELEKTVKTNVDTQAKYVWEEGYYLDTVTNAEYRWSFGDYRDEEGNTIELWDNIQWQNGGYYSLDTTELVDLYLEWKDSYWIDDETGEKVVLPSREYHSGYYASDLDSDGKFDVSGLEAFGARAEASETVLEFDNNWSYTPIFESEDFVRASHDHRYFSLLEFGGGCDTCVAGDISSIKLNANEPAWFNADWEGQYNSSLVTDETWVKHIVDYTTDTNTGAVTRTYKIQNGLGEDLIEPLADDLFVDVSEASWNYLLNDSEKGGFSINMNFKQSGDIEMDNLRIFDISNPDVPVVLLENDFTNGDEGLFVPIN